MTYSACIVAAGKGERAGGQRPKQFQILAGRPMLAWSLDVFDRHSDCEEIIIACAEGQVDEVKKLLSGSTTLSHVVIGGATRTKSVAACLDVAGCDHVLIHDAARPGVGPDLLDRLVDALKEQKGAVPSLVIADALGKVSEDGLSPVDRTGLMALQTPQAFHGTALKDAFEQMTGQDFPDEVSLARATGLQVATVQGDADNFKVTWPEDFKRMERVLMGSNGVTVTGSGFDVHRLVPGDGVTLCGVQIDCAYHIVGHSDADVGLHALTDALLGTIGAGDIGQHFPPSDPQWKDARSDRFVKHAVELIKEQGGQVVHADITLICEHPKVGPHREAMKARVADLLGLELNRVNIKATTTEKLGFTGRGEGLAAQAIATVRLS